MSYMALATWICIALGFFVSPIWFLVGLCIFGILAIVWTTYAVKEDVSLQTIALVWGIPIVMFLFLGFAIMWLPELPSEKTETQ
jgi:type II secretory pathway component PulF